MTEQRQGPGKRTVHLIGVSVVMLCLVALGLLLLLRHNDISREIQNRESGIKAGPRVTVATVGRAAGQRSVTVTAEARPYATVTLYAKVSGYLKEIRVDKGDQVAAGKLLAVIDSPELNSQYRAALVEAQNKRRFANRELLLVKDGIISQQEADDAVAAARSAEANAATLKAQRDYQMIRAPFEGVVTARFADPGALLQSAATGQTAALPVVTLSRIDRLRIYVYLDQKSASQVQLGDRAQVADPSRPERKIEARVSRISGELDPKTRTMLVELDLDNTPQRILAGAFVQVTLTLALSPYLQIPASALVSAKEKPLIAVVGSDNRVTFRAVQVADSDGKMVMLSAGVKEGERVALNPGTALSEGELVQPVGATAPSM